MDPVNQYVDCNFCGHRLVMGKPFPCSEAGVFKTPEELTEGCGAFGKPWQTDENTTPIVPKQSSEDAFMMDMSGTVNREAVEGLEFAPFSRKGTLEPMSTPFYDYMTKKPMKITGGSSDYYKLPDGATELQDLIEHKKMSFGLGNIFKAVYRLGEKPTVDEVYDLEKIIWFAQRRLAESKK